METLDFLEVSDEEEECFYEVEDIDGMHITEDGERMFEVKWKGYTSTENTFEPERNLNCPDLLEAFLKKVNANEKKEKQQVKSSTKASPPAKKKAMDFVFDQERLMSRYS
ncbi:hypothetical protein V8B55DRAFT_1112979 [Mucor lusitanicus]